jgi:Tol biopolymer transport system component
MLPGTEGVTRFSWSPDSKSLVFCAAPKAQFESAKIKTINLAGGAVRTLAADAGQFSMNQPAWSREGVILYTSGGNHRLRRVSALGGEPADATEPDSAQGETAHLWPWFLPDGRHFLYLSRKPGNSAIYIASLDSKARTSLMASNVRAVYAAPGFILFLRQQTLMAQPFDAKRLRFTGEAPQVVAENIFRNDTTGYAAFDASDDGTLIYLIRDEPATPSSHVWKDRSGKTIGPASITMRAGVGNWTLSPDDKRVAWGDEGDLFVYEFARAQLNRLTTDGTQDEVPVWSPDGSRLVFARTENKDSALYERVADGAVPERRMLAPESAVSVTPLDWSRDGQRIVFSKQLAGSGRDLWVLPLSGDQKSFPYLKTPGDKYSAAISPDGRFLAYVSNEQKKYEVFVQTFPDPKGGKWRISPNGGWAPRWRRDGRELFYLTLDGHLVAVSVNTEPRFEPGQSITLAMSLAFNPGAMGARAFPYDVSADGKRFLVREPASATGDNSTTSPLRVILNWTASLKH